MATINGKALVKDGNPLDRAYSNGQLVYGRNLLDGTKDFSGTWTNSEFWADDGTYRGLTVKKRTAQWQGIYKTFIAPKDGTFTFSAYVKVAGTGTKVNRITYINGVRYRELDITWASAFDWTRNSLTLNLNANDVVIVRYEISVVGTDSILWNAGHKWEKGTTATT